MTDVKTIYNYLSYILLVEYLVLKKKKISTYKMTSYSCKKDGQYICTLVPYYNNLFLLEKVEVGFTDDSVTYIFPDGKYFSVTMQPLDKLHQDDKDVTYYLGTDRSDYLKSVLEKHSPGSLEHLTCIVNMFYDNTENIIKLCKLVEEN